MDLESDPNSIIFNEQAEFYFQNDQTLSCICTVLEYLRLRHVEVGINIVSPEVMRRYNREYRETDKSTDILTFALLDEVDEPLTPETLPDKLAFARKLGEDPVLLGDIILSSDEVKTFSGEEVQHTYRLIIHGVLHLLGYDHERDDDRGLMAEVERKCYVHLFGEGES